MTIKTKSTSKKNKSLKNAIPTITPPPSIQSSTPPPAPGNLFTPNPSGATQSTPLPKNANIFQRIMHFIHSHIMFVNGTQVFSGIMIIMMNLGSKYVTIELSKSSAEYLKLSVTRQIMIFVLAWMGSRNIYVALGLTAVLIILTDHLFNEESSFCIVPHEYRILKDVIDTNKDGIVSKEELDNAMAILAKASKEKQMMQQKDALMTFQNSMK
jgi:hypothetical protein